MSAARNVLTLAALVCALAVPRLASAQTGGPDGSGYIYGPAVYDFQVQATNTSATMLAMGDDTVQSVTLPWAFPWYGNTYTTAVVDSNGKIMFNPGAGSTYINACLGLSGTNLPDIAPLWDDLSPNAGGGVYAFYDSALDRQIFSWEDVPHFAGTGGVSFQVHLYVSGLVEMHWADTDFGDPSQNDGLSATVGIQDAVGATQGTGNALEFSCNTASIVDGTASGFSQCVDVDTDGWPDVACGGSDCDDTNSAINPAAAEICGDGIDNDCSGSDGDVDVDGDGGIATSCAGDDCDDTDATIYVGAPELCDQLDNDCDTVVPADESSDADNDGAVTCDDCDDNDALIFPGAVETCDGIDTDCDGLYFIGAPPDVAPANTTSGTTSNIFRGNRYLVSSAAVVDHLGYELDAPAGTTITYGIYEGSSLTGPWNSVATSFLTTTQTGSVVHESPSMGVTLNIGSYYAMIAHWDLSAGYGWTSGSGLVPVTHSFGTLEGGASGSSIGGTISTSTNVYPVTVFTGQADTDDDGDNLFPCQGDCDDTNADTYPTATEICDGEDNDCDNTIPVNEVDGDGDGDLVCLTDCDDTNPDTYGGAPEICDTLDNDCDTVVPADEITDADNDSSVECADCDDTNPNAFPGATETCDGVDEDCDGSLATLDSPPVGTTSGTSSSMLRGGVYEVTSATVLDSIEALLDAGPGETLNWLVYESNTVGGTFTIIDSDTTTTTGAAGTASWLASPQLNTPLQAGMFYVLAVAWDGTTAPIGYSYGTGGFPLPTSFGNHVGGAFLNGAFQTSDSFASSTTAYNVRVLSGSEADLDSDTYLACLDDCDDNDAAVNPGATEVCDGADNDCDGVLFTGEDDADGDGGLACDDDCDDTNADVYVGAPELCDQLDNDCDTVVPADESTDADNDTFVACDDCDDNDATFNPNATELCDGLDQNCDGNLFVGGGAPDVPPTAVTPSSGGGRYRGNMYQATTATSVDHLGWELNTPVGTTIIFSVYENTATTGTWTELGRVSLLTTLTGQVVHESPSLGVALTPGNYYTFAAEWDLAATWYGWASPTLPLAVSFGDIVGGATGITMPIGGGTVGTTTLVYPMTVWTGVPEADDDNDGFFACANDCDDTDATINPNATEICDGLDNDCDGVLPADESDVDGDTYLECLDDCDDLNALTYPGATEICDGLDNDCDSALPTNESTDADNDGSPVCADCDDNNAAQTPGGVEICDGVDSDCDGQLDGQDYDIGGALVLSADLDSSDGAFVATAPTGSTGLWEYGVPLAGPNTANPGPTSAPNGTNVWGTNLEGDYATDNNTSYLALPPVTLPATGAPTFDFTYWQNNESDCLWDFGSVQIDDGSGFVALADGDACALGLSDTNDAWLPVSIDLIPYLGQTITLRFVHTSDSIISNFPGLYIDEVYVGEIADADGDGWVVCGDCDDTNPTVNEGATELCDALDTDCDGTVPADEVDIDGDGSLACVDCDDADILSFPGQTELCDGIDNNCDGQLTGATDVAPTAASSAASANIYRGNKYLASSTMTVQTLSWRMDAPVGTIIDFEILESTTQGGTYTTLAAASLTTTLTGDVFHDSPALNATLVAGNYYAMVAHWDLSSTFYWNPGAGFPVTVSFGTMVAGAYGTAWPATGGAITELTNSYPMNIVSGLDESDDDNDTFFACNDCDDTDATINPGAAEVCGNAIDEDCDGFAGTGADADGDGMDDCSGDCNDAEPTVYTGAPELCDGLDNDCDGLPLATEIDSDLDGALACEDCDDTDPLLFPGQVEACNGIDDDCDGVVPVDELDQDNDGLTGCDGDCVDTDASIPAATESCDGLDTDCDGTIPAGEADNDGDGVPICASDCDDNDANNYPGNTEVCDGQDNDCNGSADFDSSGELDGDGDGAPSCIDCDDADILNFPGNIEVCDGQDNDCDSGTDETIDFDVDTFTVCDGDCDDAEAAAYPGAEEICDDGIDNDCDPLTDETGDVDQDGETICDGDCDDDNAQTYTTGSELCDGEDNDCDGSIGADEGDADGDGFIECEDCDDADADTYPGAPELCDGLDNDCDGLPETGGGEDLDGDGYGACDGDCDDNNADVYDGAPELCDGVDNDCDTVLPDDELDVDGDTFLACLDDCDDAHPLVNPDGDEAGNCDDGVDNDCDDDIDLDDADCISGDDDDSAGDDDDSAGDDDDDATGDDDDGGEGGCSECNSSLAGEASPLGGALLTLLLGSALLRRRRLSA